MFKKSLTSSPHLVERIKQRVVSQFKEKIHFYRTQNNQSMIKRGLGLGVLGVICLFVTKSLLPNELVSSLSFILVFLSTIGLLSSINCFDAKRIFLNDVNDLVFNYNPSQLDELLDDSFFDAEFIELTSDEVKDLFSLPLSHEQISSLKKTIVEHQKLTLHHVLEVFPPIPHEDHLAHQQTQENNILSDFCDTYGLSMNLLKTDDVKKETNLMALL